MSSRPGNVAVITGGAGGIGLAVAEQLIERGMRVVLADINATKIAGHCRPTH